MLVSLIACICPALTTQLASTSPNNLILALCFVFGFVGMSWNRVYASEVARLSPADTVGRVTGAYTTSFLLTIAVSISALVSAYLAMRAEKQAINPEGNN